MSFLKKEKTIQIPTLSFSNYTAAFEYQQSVLGILLKYSQASTLSCNMSNDFPTWTVSFDDPSYDKRTYETVKRELEDVMWKYGNDRFFDSNN